jgi:hypothetical protein
MMPDGAAAAGARDADRDDDGDETAGRAGDRAADGACVVPHPATQAAVRYVPALSTLARLRSSTHDAAAVCYRFVT